MASPDLYAILGVSRDADSAAIKAAYRRQAKAAHPDHGSDGEEFRRLKDAYDVLSDPDSRAHYDATGETPDDKAAREKRREADEAAFRQLVGDLLVTTIAQAGSPAFTDILAEARRSVLVQIHAIDTELASVRNLAGRIAEVLERLREPEGEVLIGTVLSERLDKFTARVATLTELRRQLVRLVEGLERYGYEVQFESFV